MELVLKGLAEDGGEVLGDGQWSSTEHRAQSTGGLLTLILMVALKPDDGQEALKQFTWK